VARISEESDHLLKLRLNNAISAIESPAKIRESRKTIARLKTVISERQKSLNINKN
jgi:large subunit ribosomal protein L29